MSVIMHEVIYYHYNRVSRDTMQMWLRLICFWFSQCYYTGMVRTDVRLLEKQTIKWYRLSLLMYNGLDG